MSVVVSIRIVVLFLCDKSYKDDEMKKLSDFFGFDLDFSICRVGNNNFFSNTICSERFFQVKIYLDILTN